jgi:hypothetical protein
VEDIKELNKTKKQLRETEYKLKNAEKQLAEIADRMCLAIISVFPFTYFDFILQVDLK